MYIVNACDWIVMSMFHFSNDIAVFGFLCFSTRHLVTCGKTQLVICHVEQQKQMLHTDTAIPFLTRVDNS